MKRAFKVKLKAFFIIFKGISVAKNCLRRVIAPLTLTMDSMKVIYFSVVILCFYKKCACDMKLLLFTLIKL